MFRRDAVTLRPNAVDLLVVAFWILAAVSLPRAGYRWISYQWFLHHSAALILYLLLRSHPDPGGKFPGIFATLIALAAGAELLVALSQKFLLGVGRPSGTWENPNLLAEFLAYGGIAAWFLLQGRGAAGRRWTPLLVALFAGGIVLTGSRGGFLISLAAVVYLLAGRFGWKRTIAGAALAACAVLLVSNTLLTRFLGKGDPYAFERLGMWKSAVRIFLEHPMGVGVGHFKYYWPAARGPVEGSLIRYARHALTPHSEFFSVLSELGLPGAVAFLGLGAAGFLSLRRVSQAWDSGVAGAAIILFVSFLHSLVETNYHILGILLVNAAALAVVSTRLWRPLWEREVRLKGLVRGASIALLLAMVVYSGMTLAGTLFEGRGHAALKDGRLREAERRFVQAAAADLWQSSFPDSASAVQYRLYESGAGSDFLSMAVESEMDASTRNHLDFRYPARLGFLYVKAMDHFPDARKEKILGASLAAYTRAIRLNPHSAEIRVQKALALRAAGRGEESRRLLGEVLSDEPRYPAGWFFLGEALEREDRQKALAAYEKAIDLYYTYGKSAIDPDEKGFLFLDVKAVEKRVRELKEDQGR